MTRPIEIRLATLTDLDALVKVGDALFDHPIVQEQAIEFFNDSRHHLILAFDEAKVVGMASGVHYVHPDKQPALFINEVGVLTTHQNRGIGRAMVKALWAHGKQLGCKDAWIGTERTNTAAQRCYAAAGGRLDDEPFLLYEFE